MKSQNRRVLSWSFSILIHSVIIFFIVRAGLHYVFPEGEVITNTTSIDVVGGPEGQQVVNKDTSDTDKTDKEIPALPSKKIAKARPPEPKFIPYKENNSIKAAEPEKEEENEKPLTEKVPPAALPPKTEAADTKEIQVENDGVAQQLPKSEKEENPQEAAVQPEAEQSQPLQAEARQEPPTAEASPAAEVPPSQEQQNPDVAGPQGGTTQQNTPATGDGAGVPQYGTPGSTLDESKLVEMTGNEKPRYPWMAKLRHQEGTVILRAFIRKDGHVDLPILEKSSGSPYLDRECIATYAKWHYRPGPSGWVIKPFQFKLTK